MGLINAYDKEQMLLMKLEFDKGATSRQAEIDELQNDLIKAAEGQMKLFEHNNELQKRINELKAWCITGVECDVLSTTHNQALINMLKILKGEYEQR